MEENTKTWADIVVGQEFPDITYHISQQAVQDFESVVGVEHPWYEEASPFGGAIVPPTLPCTDYGLFLSQILPPIVGMHANHRLQLFRPIPVDTDVRVSCRVVDKYTKRSHRYVTMEYTIDDGNGVPYMTNTITMTVDAYILSSGVQKEQIDG